MARSLSPSLVRTLASRAWRKLVWSSVLASKERARTAKAAARRVLGLGPEEPLARIIFEFARSHPDAYVVQIGSHDSSQLDPLRPYILGRRWRGILVEPVPDVFERLKRNYAGVDGLVFENVAIAPEDGSKELYYLPQTTDESLPRWYDALASFDRDVLLSHERFIPDIEHRIEVMTVPTLSFASLLAKHGIAGVDFVQIDTEGYDHEVLKSIDLDRQRPALLQFEELHMDAQTLQTCVEAVGRHGYQTMGNGMDRLCLNPLRLGPRDARLLRTWHRLQNRRKRPASSARRPTRQAIKRRLRRGVDSVLSRIGYRLARAEPGTDPWLTRLSDTSVALPPGAEEYLAADAPRLVELRQSYADLTWPVTERGRWRDDLLHGWLDVCYFRGDTPYAWQYRERDELVSRLKFFVFLRYILERDPARLVERLGEDGAFGCWTYRYPGYPACSRDLLDSTNELYFLDRHLSLLSATKLSVLDVGAGYGRLAHRVSQAAPGLVDYCCLDAIPESTFLCEYYTCFRGLTPPVRVVPLPDVPNLEAGSFDIAFNVHSFSECSLAAVEWWVDRLVSLDIPRLFLVPNEPEGFLTTEPDGSRRDYAPALASAGYELVAEERKFTDEAVREILGVSDRYCLFELRR